MRSRPNPSAGHGDSDATQSVADCIELAPVPLELDALAFDHRSGRVGDEPLVREHAFGTRNLLAQPLALGVGIAVARRSALRLYDGLEDAQLVALELRQHAGAAEPLRV